MGNVNGLLHERMDLKFGSNGTLLHQWQQIQENLPNDYWFGDGIKSDQIAVQGSVYDENPYRDSCGRHQLKGTGRKSSEWNIVNDVFRGTLFEHICQITQAYKMRVMRLYPKCMYSVHIDKSPRFHIVINTNPGCFFLWPDRNELLHMPADGHVYYTNTCPRHTFCNSGDEYRDHIVFQSDRLMEDYEGTWERLPKDTPRGVL